MPADLTALLVGFQAADSQALHDLPSHPLLRTLAKFSARRLPQDIVPEVVQETFAMLLSPTIKPFDANRGKASAYLFGIVRNAAQRVRASYCHPGTKTRYDKRKRVPDPAPIPFDEEQHLPTAPNVAAMNGVIDLWRGVPPALAEIVHEVFAVGHAVSEVAKRRRMSRFAVHRQLRTFIDSKQHIL